MSVLTEFRAAVLAVIATEIPSVQVVGGPPAEDQKVKESVWVARAESEFEWRSLGTGAQLLKNRTEEIGLELRVHVYREGPDQLDTQATALARCEELIDEIESAIAPFPSVGSTVTHARLARIAVTPRPAFQGWVADGEARIEAINHP